MRDPSGDQTGDPNTTPGTAYETLDPPRSSIVARAPLSSTTAISKAAETPGGAADGAFGATEEAVGAADEPGATPDEADGTPGEADGAPYGGDATTRTLPCVVTSPVARTITIAAKTPTSTSGSTIRRRPWEPPPASWGAGSCSPSVRGSGIAQTIREDSSGGSPGLDSRRSWSASTETPAEPAAVAT